MTLSRTFRPTKEQLLAARNRAVPDVIAPGLDVLFCGINPGLYSGATGHHFSRPGNRFWPTLFNSGFTDRLLSPFEEHSLLVYGLGITNLVERATARADEIPRDEIVAGARRLEQELSSYEPKIVALLGISVYKTALGAPGATIGRQPETIAGVPVWLLPNPSGLNAHYQLPDLARIFAELRAAVG